MGRPGSIDAAAAAAAAGRGRINEYIIICSEGDVVVNFKLDSTASRGAGGRLRLGLVRKLVTGGGPNFSERWAEECKGVCSTETNTVEKRSRMQL